MGIQEKRASYMPIYEQPPPLEGPSSGPSTLLSTVSSSHDDPCTSTSTSGAQCNIYENVEEYSHLYNCRTEERPRVPAHRSASTSRIPIAESSLPPRSSIQLNIDFIKHIPPPPPLEAKMTESEYGTHPRSVHSTSSIGRRPIDMRPLSIPAHEMKRMEKEEGGKRVVIGLTIATFFVFGFAFAIYFFFDKIENFFKELKLE